MRRVWTYSQRVTSMLTQPFQIYSCYNWCKQPSDSKWCVSIRIFTVVSDWSHWRTLYESVNKNSIFLFQVRDLTREDIEKDLTFAGFVIISCPLKTDSKAVVKEIQNASHHVRCYISVVLRIFLVLLFSGTNLCLWVSMVFCDKFSSVPLCQLLRNNFRLNPLTCIPCVDCAPENCWTTVFLVASIKCFFIM